MSPPYAGNSTCVCSPCNALDKGNLGNAKTDGMDKDLGFMGNQDNTMLSIFYVPHVVFAPPIGMLGKKYGRSRVLPIMMFCFGSATSVASCVRGWSGMMTLRWGLGMCDVKRVEGRGRASREVYVRMALMCLIGMSESAFFPLVIYYLTTFYRRGNLLDVLPCFTWRLRGVQHRQRVFRSPGLRRLPN
jgi:MFS family permease